MNYPTVSVNGVSVRVDEEGRYSLNDLHASAVCSAQAKENQGPSQFLRSKKVKDFVQTLARMQKCTLEENQPVKVINGGVNQGVWAVEIVAIRYAAWLSAEFEIRVYQTFQTLMRRGFDAMSRLNKIDCIIKTESKEISQCASQMAKWGVGGRKRLLHTARERIADEVQMYLPGF
ncbi:KilA-N domain-containing protein [Serratia ureilytica]|uniref:KilA-N domain-containing protein n=1 Tax=Serratia ureilytica TaxID=300181 RepID=UPI0018A6ED5E|nr:KilA-N domain-containing protein [Serratia ureilytica]MBF4186950.1 KilA-N domain-containing protein [Serratia ureilytica]MBF8442354.1 KilA-N domain-containing protein [Serratia ureilytica]MBF8446049.1 KilA-N domain-containing protein [Serratia ureilytica]